MKSSVGGEGRFGSLLPNSAIQGYPKHNIFHRALSAVSCFSRRRMEAQTGWGGCLQGVDMTLGKLGMTGR